MPRPLILASQSASRAEVLRHARVGFEAVAARVDEAAVKTAMLAEAAPPRDIADALAELKARRVATRRPDALVLGCDQMLVCEGRTFDKPMDVAAARAQLRVLRGRVHELLSAAVVFEDARPVWRHVGRARLTMRAFSDEFLESYLNEQGSAVLASVGGYKLEDGGAQLFARVEGDIFTVMGVPLLELLGFLRSRGVCAE